MTTNSVSKEQIAETARIEQAITEVFGERCEAFDPDCMSCQAWAEVQAIKDLSLRTSSGGVTSGEVVEALENTQTLLASMLHEARPAAEIEAQIVENRAALSSLHAQPEGDPDDQAVDRFAASMKAKLAKKREEGSGGWERKDECSPEFLSQLLREHVEKGDPLDVGNLAMMLHQRDERITP